MTVQVASSTRESVQDWNGSIEVTVRTMSDESMTMMSTMYSNGSALLHD